MGLNTIGLVRSHMWKLLEEVQGVMDMRSWNDCYYLRTLQTLISLSLGGSATTALVAVPCQRAHWLLPPLYSCVLCDC